MNKDLIILCGHWQWPNKWFHPSLVWRTNEGFFVFVSVFWFFWGWGATSKRMGDLKVAASLKKTAKSCVRTQERCVSGDPCGAFRPFHWRVFCPEKLPPGFRKRASCPVSPVASWASWVCRASSLPPGGNVQLGGNSYRTAACYWG